MGHVETLAASEALAHDVRAGAERAEGVLAGVGLHHGGELAHVARRELGLHREHQVGQADLGDGLEVLQRVVGDLGEQRRVLDVGGDGHEQRLAVGRGAGDLLAADHAAGAGAVLDNDGLAPELGELAGEQPAGEVGGAARGKGHDHPDGLCGKRAGLGERGWRNGSAGGRRRGGERAAHEQTAGRGGSGHA